MGNGWRRMVLCILKATNLSISNPEALSLFTLFTSDFTHNTNNCHLQKFSDDTAIVGCISEGNEQEYRQVIKDFVNWCQLNHLHLNASKTQEMIIDFRRKAPPTTQVNILGMDIETVTSYKYLGVHLNNRLDWADNTDATFRKGQSRLHLLRRLKSFGVCRPLLRTFYDTMVASVVFYSVVCWRGGGLGKGQEKNKQTDKKSQFCPVQPPGDC